MPIEASSPRMGLVQSASRRKASVRARTVVTSLAIVVFLPLLCACGDDDTEDKANDAGLDEPAPLAAEPAPALDLDLSVADGAIDGAVICDGEEPQPFTANEASGAAGLYLASFTFEGFDYRPIDLSGSSSPTAASEAVRAGSAVTAGSATFVVRPQPRPLALRWIGQSCSTGGSNGSRSELIRTRARLGPPRHRAARSP